MTVVPIIDAFRQSKFGESLRDSAANESLRPKVLQKKRQPVAEFTMLRCRCREPELITRQRVQTALQRGLVLLVLPIRTICSPSRVMIRDSVGWLTLSSR
jgi:hypothetical protein